MILKTQNRKRKIRLIIILIMFLTLLFFTIKWLNSETVKFRGKYNDTFSISILAASNDMGRIMDFGPTDTPWKRRIFLIKNEKDSLGFSLSLSNYIGFSINEDTINLDGKTIPIMAIGNIDGIFELIINTQNMKIIEKEPLKQKIWWQLKKENNRNYPENYLKLHSR